MAFSILPPRNPLLMVSLGSLNTIREAQRRRKLVCVAWLDLANAFGSVHHDLIAFCLAHYHAPQQTTQLVSELYGGLSEFISTKSWTTVPIRLQLGAYQGDPLSVVIFNTVMNTLVYSITLCCSKPGYNLSSFSSAINLLQYADDTTPIGDGPASCQRLLDVTESWLSWTGMRANIPKCASVAIKASTGKARNPNLKLRMSAFPTLVTPHFTFLELQLPSTQPRLRPGHTS